MDASVQSLIKIAMLPKFCRDGSSSRLRMYQYIDSSAFSDFEIDVYPLYGERYISDLYQRGRRDKLAVLFAYTKRFLILFKLFRYDVIWMEKEFFPRLPSLFEKILAKLGVSYVVDYDDATFHDYDLSKNIFVRRFLGHKIDSVMQAASCVVCGNKYIQDRAVIAGAKNTIIVPTVVDTSKYAIQLSNTGQFTIGWIGSPPTEKYLSLIQSPLKKVLAQHKGHLLLVGTTEKVREWFSDVDLELKTWSEEKESEYLDQIDVGIMPLKDEPWERGKCGFKLLQYMACGKPVVASPVGVNVEIVEGADCGRLAKTEGDWYTCLNELAVDQPLREKLGRNGRVAVERVYALEIQSSRVATVLTEAARSSTAI